MQTLKINLNGIIKAENFEWNIAMKRKYQIELWFIINGVEKNHWTYVSDQRA